jgi:uracil-DNA glycosylase
VDPLDREKRLFLRSLEVDGIETVYQDARTGGIRQPTAEKSPVAGTGSVREQLLAFREKVLTCTQCGELSTTRKSVVFGSGNVKASLMFVGEAPGFDEDAQGLPFVGRAGQLLTKIIASIGLDRKQVFICNVLKCRPPGNRSPLPEEVMNCSPYLYEQIRLIRPRVICALGNFASQTLLKTAQSISRLRGRFHDMPLEDADDRIRVMCTYHPAYLLRNPEDKRKVWEDMKMIREELAEA